MKSFLISCSKISVFIFLFCLWQNALNAQDSTATKIVKKKYVKRTFEGNYIIDNQSVMVPQAKTLSFDIQHRFGTVQNSFHDFFGFFNIATMRLAVEYTPVKNLQIGTGLSGDRNQVDFNLKYAILRQTEDGSMPISMTYFGDMAIDTRGSYDTTAMYISFGQRFSYFHQIIIARKFSENFSLQIAPSWSHFNSIVGSDGNMVVGMRDNHFAVAFSGRYKISPKTAIIAGYDMPLSNTNGIIPNPLPNLSLGFDFTTSGHDFQVFIGNYAHILPQNNNYYNQNSDNMLSQFLIGFNISRLWNF
ncbi:MAG: hypothetical protein KGL19_11900 [Bacteroidota bacterium]|nr:hypothetical protein [Bacteroidota bacterium]